MIGNKLEPFKFWCQKVLPNVYDDSLSYYEYLCKLNEYLNEVIGQINTLTDNMEDYEADLTATWLETKEYIDNYFNNLDVQQEINNKLDAMAESGALSTLLAPIVGTQIGVVVAEQIGATVASQIGATVASQIDASVASQIDTPTASATSAWLTEHVNPVGSAVTVDDTLTISGSAGDAKVTGERLGAIENGNHSSTLTGGNADHTANYVFCNGKPYKFTNNTDNIVNLRLVDNNGNSTTLIGSLASGSTYKFVCDGTDYVAYKSYFAGTGSCLLECDDDGIYDYVNDVKENIEENVYDFTSNFQKKLITNTDYTEVGYLNPNGVLVEVSGWVTTDYIEIPNNDTYITYYGVGGETAENLPTICYYDNNHNTVATAHAEFNDNEFSITNLINDAKYIRVTTSISARPNSYVECKVLAEELAKTINEVKDTKSTLLNNIGTNYSSWAYTPGPTSSTWYGMGSTVIVPTNSKFLKIVFKTASTQDMLIECLKSGVTFFSKTINLTSGEHEVFVPLNDISANDTIVARVSSAQSGVMYQCTNVSATDYADTSHCYAKNSSSWSSYANTSFSVPVYFYDILPEYAFDSDLKQNIYAHNSIPDIYVSQFSDDIAHTPTTPIFVDSVIRIKQDVLFNGMDRFYVPIQNGASQSSNVVTTSASATLSGDGYNDKNYTFNVISSKTSALSDKSAVVLQVGDSVTAGAGSMYNTDSKPDISWAYMAYLGKKYLQNYEQVGYNSEETINLSGGGTYVAKAEGIGGWSLYDFLYNSEKEVSGVVKQNLFYDSAKVWSNQNLNNAGVKFSINKYISNTEITTPTHIILQLGFNDNTSSNFIQNVEYAILAIKEEFPNMIIGLSLLRDYGIFYNKYYEKLAPNESAYHGYLYSKMQSWLDDYIALEDTSNSIYYIPTFFVSPTGDAVPTYEIDDLNVAFRTDGGYHPNHKAHVEWGKQCFAWLAYTLLS